MRQFAVSHTRLSGVQWIFFAHSLHWWVALIVSVLGIAAICLRALETDEVRAKRTERNKKKELRSLAERISSYGHTVHQRYAIKCYVAMAGDANPVATCPTLKSITHNSANNRETIPRRASLLNS